MPRYVSFLLDLAGAVEVRAIEASIRFVPDADKALVPTNNVFLWKIVVSEQGEVWVRGLLGGRYVLIAAARWQEGDGEGAIVDQRQREPQNPTGFQWNLIEDSVRYAQSKAKAAFDKGVTSGPGPGDEIERPSTKELATLTSPEEGNAEMQKNLRRADAEAKKATEAARRSRQGRWIGIVVGTCVIAAVVVPVVYAYHKHSQDKVPVPTYANGEHVPIPKSGTVTTDPAPEPTAMAITPDPVIDAPTIDASPDQAVMTAETLPSAIALARSAFTPESNDAVSPGALRLAHFNHMQWSDVDVPTETTIPLAEKDVEPELGKRMCVEGELLAITRQDLEQPPRPPKKTYVGKLQTTDGDRVAFVALGSTGTLVKRMTGRFCGVVTGTARGDLELVGMFDLPETRTPQAEQ